MHGVVNMAPYELKIAHPELFSFTEALLWGILKMMKLKCL
jgi:hypothetical protein